MFNIWKQILLGRNISYISDCIHISDIWTDIWIME